MVFKSKYLSILALFICFVVPATSFAAVYSVIVRFHQPPGQYEQKLIQTIGGTVNRVYSLIPAIAATIPESALAGLRNNPLVAYVEENKTVTIIEPTYTPLALNSFTPKGVVGDAEYQAVWGVRHIGSKVAHDKGITGSGVKVAVIDTGINYDHPDLIGNYKGGYDFFYNDSDPMDDNGHGTHVAGTIGAKLNAVGVVGVAPEVSLYAVKAFDFNGVGDETAVIAGIQWAVDNGMDIINFSAKIPDSGIFREACNAAYDAGLLIVAATGNYLFDNDVGPVSFPAAYDSVIAVAATDGIDGRWLRSALGPEVELAAPGVGIRSTSLDGGDIEMTGTSMATAHISGTAALIISAGVGDTNYDGRVDNREVRQRLQMTAVDLGVPGRDEAYGYGRVSVEKAMAASVTVSSINLLKESTWFDSLKMTTLEDASFQVSIQNNSLKGVFVLVIENHRIRKDLLIRQFFDNSQGDIFQQVTFDLDATGTVFDIVFIPLGSIGTSANITIQK